MAIEWEPVPDGYQPLPEPASPPPCPIGMGHTWRLLLVEGQAELEPIEPCTGDCTEWIGNNPELLGTIDLGIVRLSWEHGGYGPTDPEAEHFVAVTAVSDSDWPTKHTEATS
jgi:hypothetical protein